LVGADPGVKVTGEEELAGKSNYFLGKDPRNWHRDVATYARVRYRGLYRGVDVEYYGRQGELEYDFRVGPGADPGQVRFRIEGAERVGVNGAGELELKTAAGELVLRRPEAYQGEGASKRWVAARYVRRGKGEFGFEVGGYRRNQELIIDPFLTYSTYLGGSGGDVAHGIAVDSSGNAYVTGVTGSTNFPVKSAAQTSGGVGGDAFVSKLNATGSGLAYSTYLGGSGSDSGSAIAIDSSGNAYIVGSTSSSDFPVTPSAFQPTYGGGGYPDAFVAKLDPTGSVLVYASYLGGSNADYGQGIAVDASGNAYVTGSTQSPDFPTVKPLQIGNDGCSLVYNVQSCTADAFVAEINSGGTALVYSTYLGGSAADLGQAIVVDTQGNTYIAGYTYSSDFPTQDALQSALGGASDAFVTELKAGGSGFVFSTYLGGEGLDQAFGIALDASGSIYITGGTQSANFPATPNVFQTSYAGKGDAFVSKLSPGGGTIVYSTFIGGSDVDLGYGIAVDSAGNVVAVGVTQSSDFPTVDPPQRILGLSGAGTCSTGICSDAFVTRLDPSGAPLYSTYLGGAGADFAQAVAVDSSGVPYVAGGTSSSNFPAIVGALQSAYAGIGSSGNAFVVRIDPSDAPAAALTPQAVNFGNQTLNVASAPQTVTLINIGSSPLQITDITAGNDFAETNNCGTTVPAGGGICTLSITFTPVTAGPTTDQVTISDNAAGSPHSITVTGSGITPGAAVLTLTPTRLTFPTEPIGVTSPAQVVQLVNGSQSAITITEISISGNFAETHNCGAQPSVLNPGASCAVSVTFTPTSSGALTGSLRITDNAEGSPQSVSLSGTGGSPFTLSTPNRTSVTLIGTKSTTFTVSASAPSSFTSSISLSCSSGATCSFDPSSITPGQSSTLTVSGLSASTSNPLNLSVTGTSGSYKTTLSLTVFFSDFSISAAPGLNSVTAGQSATYTVTVAPSNGFNQVVLLSCGGTLPNATTCSWSPPGVTLNGSTTSAASLKVTTTSEFAAAHGQSRHRFPGAPGLGGKPEGIPWLLAAFMMALLAACLAASRRLPHGLPGQTRWVAVMLGVMLLALTGMSCNSYYYNPITPANPVGTPTGNYVIIITGTLGTDASVTRSTTVNLTVGPG